MFEVSGLEAAYDTTQVLFGVAFNVEAGEVVTMLGRNGMGKTTTVRAIFGVVPPRAGSIRFEGHELRGLPPHVIARRGLGLVPEGRQIFPNLTVEENLTTTAISIGRDSRDSGWTVDRVYALFPRLAERRRNMGDQLSGGEQQMLSIGRALMTNPKLLVLDEATEGLAPIARREIWRVLGELKARQQSILLIDKNIDALTRIADRHHILEKGRVVWTGSSVELLADRGLLSRNLAV
jgi:branched-chain amino acid transport system ATP-binding protein